MLTYFTQSEYRKITYLGLTIQLLAAVFSIGYNHPDEHWQVLEFANYKLGFSSAADLPWEYKDQIRQAWQPFLAFLLGKGLLSVHLYNPFILALLLRLLTAIASYFTALQVVAFFLQKTTQQSLHKSALWLVNFLWFLPYVRAHFHSETLSGVLFFLGLVLLLRALQSDGRHMSRIFIAGLLMGGAFESRFQIAFAIVGTAVYLLIYQRPTWRQALVWMAGFGLILVVGVLIDYWFYGTWVFAPYRYFEMNIVQDKASAWGTSPFWYYLALVAESAAPPLSILLLIAGFLGMILYPKHILTWVFGLFILAHSLVPHKEVRFLFPLVFALPVVLALGWHSEAWQKVLRASPKWLYSGLLYLLLFENGALLAIATLKPANESVALFSYIYRYAHNEPIVVYTLDKNPYIWGGLPINFYRPAHLRVIQATSIEWVIQEMQQDNGQKKLFFYEGFSFDEKYPKEATHFRGLTKTIPSWLTYFNFNNWLSRARVWSLYEVTPTPSTERINP
ncbi:MAG: hypothetical protein V4714_13725 [Bacteroidota bacterium]